MRILLLRSYILLLISIFGVFTYSFFYDQPELQIEPQDGYIVFEVIDQRQEIVFKDTLYYADDTVKIISVLTSKKNITIV